MLTANDNSQEAAPTQLIDRYSRRLDYLRISITDRCNLRCLYCMPPGGITKMDMEEILTYEEILRVVEIGANLGIEKIRLTGGEPLVRNGIDEFIPRLTAIPGIKDVSLTTNGVYLRDHLEGFRRAGIKRINVSLDSLRRFTYKRVTGFDALEQVWEGIQLALEMGFSPIKLNTVVMKDLNDHEVLDFAGLTLNYPLVVRFIEYMPSGVAKPEIPIHHVPNASVKERISTLGRLVEVARDHFDGPADRFRFEGAPGEIGFIGARTHPFCHRCNRLRLTASGRLRPCLLSDLEEDLKTPIRSGATDRELADVFVKAAKSKPYAHSLAREEASPLGGRMSSIGG